MYQCGKMAIISKRYNCRTVYYYLNFIKKSYMYECLNICRINLNENTLDY